ncbi:hypothetical protein V490_00405, partial [Pseudogymnoascus sp. VKM F-3557]
ITIPWDRMDPEYLAVPQRWDIKDLVRFIIILGPTSSTIDICTFSINWFYYGIRDPGDTLGLEKFHTHWFLTGLLTQTLVVHLLRTEKIPGLQSRAAKPLIFSTVTIILIGFAVPYIPPFAHALGLVNPNPSFVGFLALLFFSNRDVDFYKLRSECGGLFWYAAEELCPGYLHKASPADACLVEIARRDCSSEPNHRQQVDTKPPRDVLGYSAIPSPVDEEPCESHYLKAKDAYSAILDNIGCICKVLLSLNLDSCCVALPKRFNAPLTPRECKAEIAIYLFPRGAHAFSASAALATTSLMRCANP